MTSRDNLRDRRRSSDRQRDDGHGRTVARPCRVTSDLDRREGREAGTGPRSGVLGASERSLGDAPSVARRSSLGSPGSDARLWNEAVRSHWGGGGEVAAPGAGRDGRRGPKPDQEGQCPENFTLRRQLALCLLKQEAASKQSIKSQRLKALGTGITSCESCGGGLNFRYACPGTRGTWFLLLRRVRTQRRNRNYLLARCRTG